MADKKEPETSEAPAVEHHPGVHVVPEPTGKVGPDSTSEERADHQGLGAHALAGPSSAALNPLAYPDPEDGVKKKAEKKAEKKAAKKAAKKSSK